MLHYPSVALCLRHGRCVCGLIHRKARGKAPTNGNPLWLNHVRRPAARWAADWFVRYGRRWPVFLSFSSRHRPRRRRPGWTQSARPAETCDRSPPIPATRGGSTSERPTVSSIARTTADAAGNGSYPVSRGAASVSMRSRSTNAAFSTWDSMRSTGMAAVWRGQRPRPYVPLLKESTGSVRGPRPGAVGRESRRGRHPLGRVPLSRRRRHVAPNHAARPS